MRATAIRASRFGVRATRRAAVAWQQASLSSAAGGGTVPLQEAVDAQFAVSASPAASRNAPPRLQQAVLDGGSKVLVKWANGEERVFHTCWLRDQCMCADCMSSSGQKQDRPIGAVLPGKQVPQQVEVEENGESMKIMWPDHTNGTVTYKSDWLLRHAYSGDTITRESEDRCYYKPLDKLPELEFEHIVGSEEGEFDWMNLMNKAGYCLARNAPTVDGTVRRIADLVGGPSHAIYGDIFDVKVVVNPINIAYTDTALAPHMDLSYFESPPGIQILHCMAFDDNVAGGDSTLIDGHAVAEEFQKREPELFKILETVPATFQKDHVDRADPMKMFYQRPHISTNYLGHVTAVYWSPQFQGPLRVREDFVEPYYKAVEAFRTLLASDEMVEQFGVQLRMKPGDMLIFNNRRMLHGRTSFTASGKRHLQGCYMSVDPYLNRYRVLSLKLKGKTEQGCMGPIDETRFGTSSHR